LGLFREHVFKQVTENGTPVLDFGHIVECLNKLDLGIEERLALVSRDNATVLVAAYKELKLASDAAFKQLLRKVASSAPAGHHLSHHHGGAPFVPRSTRPPTHHPRDSLLVSRFPHVHT